MSSKYSSASNGHPNGSSSSSHSPTTGTFTGMKKGQSGAGSNNLILRRQLMELRKRPVDGFSAGLVDEANIYEWDIMIMGPADTLYEGAFLKARMSFPEEYPLLPPKLKFITEMWHPNVYPDGNVCISILHPPGDDQWGYEDAGERWLPVHTVETVEVPDLNSPANVDAAKQVREDFAGFKKRVKRLVRRSQEEAFDD